MKNGKNSLVLMKTENKPFRIYGPTGLIKKILVPCFYDELAGDWFMTKEAHEIASKEKRRLFDDRPQTSTCYDENGIEIDY